MPTCFNHSSPSCRPHFGVGPSVGPARALRPPRPLDTEFYPERPVGRHSHAPQTDVTGLLERFEATTGQPAPTPEVEARSLVSSDDDDDELLSTEDKLMYQSITGGLMFAMVTCRPDLAHAVNMLARRMSRPRAVDLRAARCVLQYLRGTEQLGSLFTHGEDARDAQEKGRVVISKVHTSLKHADIMTKATDNATFARHVKSFMVARR